LTLTLITVAELYIIIFKTAIAHPDSGHGREGYYFAENGEHSLYEVGKRIAETLVELGKGKSVDPTTYSDEELAKYFGVGVETSSIDFTTDITYLAGSLDGD
jgi:hypothetical protein